MPIGFLRDDQEFTPQPKTEPVEQDLDFAQMWEEGLSHTSIESRSARNEYDRFVR
jgi:hypothetical protein